MPGVWLALAAAQLIGFGAAGLVVQWQSGAAGAGHYVALAVCSEMTWIAAWPVARLRRSLAGARLAPWSKP